MYRSTEKLRAHDVPAYAEVDAGYFEEKEVSLVLALLAVIDNAHQDIPLAAVLHSMVWEMTAADLLIRYTIFGVSFNVSKMHI